jgi:hypothetical protein
MKEKIRIYDQIINEFPEIIAKLINDLRQTENTVSRIEAKNKLEKMGRETLPYLHKLLEVEDNLLRREVAKIMGYIADKSSIPDFILLLDDSDNGIRWIAAEGLVHIGRESIIPLLRSIIDNQQGTYFLKTGAHHVFKSLFNDEEKIKFKALMRSLQDYTEISVALSLETLYALKTLSK